MSLCLKCHALNPCLNVSFCFSFRMSAPYVVAQLGVACCGVLVKVQQIAPISTKLRHDDRKKQYHVALEKYDGKWLR